MSPRPVLPGHPLLRAGGRVARLRRRGWQIAQCAVGAALAWLLATEVLHHPQPFFAPVAAVVALGLSYGQRFRRVAEVVVGVAIGVGVGDLFVHLVGTGAWQIAVVVAVAMSLAVLLDAGTLIVTQAGVQAVIVTTLLPNPELGLSRWLDAVVGGAVALLVAAIAPGTPLRRPRQLAVAALVDLADLLRDAADSARDGDPERAALVLQRARQTEAGLAALRQASVESLDVVRVSPFRRRHRGGVRRLAQRSVPLDHAVRNVRVLVRRVLAATRTGETLPAALTDLVDDLSEATGMLAEQLGTDASPGPAVERLVAVAEASAEVPRGSLSGDVVLGQVRSTVVDLLTVAGLDDAEALSRVPASTTHLRADGEPL
jgi:uncharacterized membrane protein YgaE (UPF0421/DUF939 family)